MAPMTTTSPLRDTRLLPADPAVRTLAADLLVTVADAPILSPHGHVPVEWLSRDLPFSDPADLLVVHDHYVTRLLHARGVPLDRLGASADPREAWRELCRHWHAFAGTASAFWLSDTLATVFGIEEDLAEDTADATYDAIAAHLTRPELRPRALFDRFRIDTLATTDDPLSDLAEHALLAADAGFGGRVVPTFRPDRYLDPEGEGFAVHVEALLAATGRPATFAGYLAALEDRRAHFRAHGAFSADHGVYEPFTCELEPAEAERLLRAALSGEIDAAGARLFRGHMLWQMARMSVEDGLVMTVHAGVRRNHHTATYRAFGPDTGHDIPVRTEWVENLRPLLESFGTAPGFHLILFTVDETTFSRELAPLAGFYPAVRVGAPWWFLDAPDAIARFRGAVTETAGFYRTSGFIDDTRAYLSIPSRHAAARRADAAYLARLVAEGRIREGLAHRIMADTVDAIPREAFKL